MEAVGKTNCIICKKNISSFLGFKSADGKICPGCFKRLSPIWQNSIEFLNTLDIERFIAYKEESDEMSKVFTCTHSLGNCYLDAVNELFVIGDKRLFKDDRLKENPLDIYSCGNITDFSMDFIPQKNRKYGDSFIKLSLSHPYFSLTEKIKENMMFETEIKDNYIYYYKPKAFMSFYQTFINTIEKASKRSWKYSTDISLAKEEKDLPKRKEAMALFMLEEGFSKEDLKRQKNILLKAFHPDSKNTESGAYVQKILDAYKVLGGS